MEDKQILDFNKRFNKLSLATQNIFMFNTVIQLLEVSLGNNNGKVVNNLLKLYEDKEKEMK